MWCPRLRRTSDAFAQVWPRSIRNIHELRPWFSGVQFLIIRKCQGQEKNKDLLQLPFTSENGVRALNVRISYTAHGQGDTQRDSSHVLLQVSAGLEVATLWCRVTSNKIECLGCFT
eukprot:4367636-Amphidinium_carterae.1